jgi:hypothetical protein
MVTAAPEQVIPSLAVVPELSTTDVVGVGSGLTVIAPEVEAEQPFAFVTVTE